MSTIKARQFHLIEDLDIAAITYGIVEKFEAFARKIIHTINVWTSRSRERYHLGQMSNHLMQDIGLTRADVALEVNKYFWQK